MFADILPDISPRVPSLCVVFFFCLSFSRRVLPRSALEMQRRAEWPHKLQASRWTSANERAGSMRDRQPERERGRERQEAEADWLSDRGRRETMNRIMCLSGPTRNSNDEHPHMGVTAPSNKWDFLLLLGANNNNYGTLCSLLYTSTVTDDAYTTHDIRDLFL